jgi:hypothetical protein
MKGDPQGDETWMLGAQMSRDEAVEFALTGS